MNLAATKATDSHGSATHHTHINTMALVSWDPQSQVQMDARAWLLLQKGPYCYLWI